SCWKSRGIRISNIVLAKPALTWWETHVKALAARNSGNQIGDLNTAGEFQDKAAAEIGRIGAGLTTGADIIPAGTWEEDWSIAGGEPTNDVPVVPNAVGGLPAVTIAPNITLGQFFYLVRTAYTMVEHLKHMAVFGQLTQSNMTVKQFSARIKKIGKLAEMTPKQQREQFICGLNPMNQYNIRMMAKFDNTQDNITKALAEAEKFTLSQASAPSSFSIFPAANPYIDTNKSGMTKEQIENLVKNIMVSTQSQQIQVQQSQQMQSNSDNYPRVPDKYMPERPPDGYGINSERFIHADIMNPISSTSQIMESLANDLYKKLSDMFLAKSI
ncbi:9277_t:CDS:2, partial [Acaulospora morrowiae]